jgi:SulP family sulfate permease
VPAIDSTAMHALQDLVRRTRRDGTPVLLSDVQPQPRLALQRSELLNDIGAQHVLDNIDEALAAARTHLGSPVESSRTKSGLRD